jgi:ATP-dependent helicase HrpA
MGTFVRIAMPRPSPRGSAAVPVLPPLNFPAELPVSARREDIARALRDHQVVIVCGETGSGKTTQLPKIALSLGRGLAAGGRGLIGHTQPRRLAAVSVARRIAQELGSAPGEHVGYKVRFHERVQPGASIKLMTDGILLAETQRDPLLRAYDTLIIDEAHERSLNIDFLLGYLRSILPRRPDLKLVITSATIDAERFARHFASAAGPAPVVEVSGRLYPVEIRWRPLLPAARAEGRADGRAEGRAEADLLASICDAVDELWRVGSGDILVFLPGEREIREATEALRKHHLDTARRGVEILPLYARLSQAEQDRVFAAGGAARRVVLATNVAETSLTVPGIRYVIDSGVARVKRYSYRQKVEQLQVEPISQAAAAQRAGRCGRVADGVCIRLYDEADFAARPRFTDPEIQRSSLAAVILRMRALGLAAVEEFPFIDPPARRAIADGYQLLAELGAVDGANELTEVGRELARLPLDPRLGRMILEARRQGALAEVLVIAAALAVQDPRERPAERQEAADTAHRRFVEGGSELAGWLKLWAHYHELVAHKKSNRKLHEQLRAEFLSPLRMREWHDVHAQLHTVVAEQGWSLNAQPANDVALHCSLLAGLLGNVGCKDDESAQYLGARGIRFLIHPSSPLARKAGRWIMAADLVETTRLYARGVARIEPQWLERIGAHLLVKTLAEPHWEKKPARVSAFERATLYGLVVYNQRRVDYGRIDPQLSRELFIRHALVESEWDCRWPFLAHNRKLVEQIEALEDRARRRDLLVDDALIEAFYQRFVPDEVCSGASFDAWYREAQREQPRLLFLERDALMRHEAAGITTESFPTRLRVGALELQLSYSFDPGGVRDGVTATVPLAALNQIPEQRLDWLVPGMLGDKVAALLKSLPQKLRSRLVPLADSAREFTEQLGSAERYAQGDLLDALRALVRERTGLIPRAEDFKPDALGAHARFNLRVVDADGRQLAMGRNLARLRAELADAARAAFRDAVRGHGAAPAPSAEPASATAGATPPGRAAGRPGPNAAGGAAAPAPSRAGAARGDAARAPQAPAAGAAADTARHTAWTFGALPELLEIRRGGQSLVGFPGLVDRGEHVELDVFDTPEAAQQLHRAGLRRLFALQLREPLKAAEKNLPGLQNAAMLYMPLGSAEDLRRQVIDAALDLAFLGEPLPADAAAFAARLAEGRPRLQLLAAEMARLAGTVLGEWAAANRKLAAFKSHPALHADVAAQLQALVPRRFMLEVPPTARGHLPRYLKAVQLRLDKFRADPARDAQRQAEMAPLLARLKRELAAGAADARLVELRWMLEELRVALFAQELRTPAPVSVKRIERAWSQWQA